MNRQISVLFFLAGVLFTTSLLISNILAVKIIQIGAWSAPAGIIVFPLAYILNDVITEVWGYNKAKLIIWTGFAMNLVMVVFFSIAIKLDSADYWPYQKAFNTVLGSTPRIVIASMMAYLTGSLLNAFVLSKMKIVAKGKNFSIRAITSTLVGESADSITFITFAFWGIFGFSALLNMILVQIALKTAYEILILPITILIVNRIKKVEGTTAFDAEVTFNPFKISQL